MGLSKIQRGTPAYHRMTFAMLLAGLATFATFYCVQPLLPLFSDLFGVNAEEASLVVSITIGPMAFALLVASLISDRIGRRPLMIGSLLLAALFTLLCSVTQGWTMLLVLRFLVGISLAGVPAVAMAYIVEEVDDSSVSHAMGIYIGGTAMGGLAGRLLGGIITDLAGWRVAIAVVGGFMLVTALAFWRTAPRSAHFAPRAISARAYWGSVQNLFSDRAIPWLFAESFLLMGAFVALYNYIGYRLIEAPYYLSQSVVSAIFLLYILGSFSSTTVGSLAGKYGPPRMLWIVLLIFLVGIAVTMFAPLPLVIVGMAIVTVGFFGAHSVASAWVGRRARADRALGSAFYLFFYYMGGSILGSVGGFAWTHGGWPGVAGFTGMLLAMAVLIGIKLAKILPLPPAGLPSEPSPAES
jgi:YNFM family putative membrane transporter